MQEGPGGLVGLRLGFGPRLGLRLETTIEYLAESGATSERMWDVGAQVGLSIYAGPLGARDSDRDGVPNWRRPLRGHAARACRSTRPGARCRATAMATACWTGPIAARAPRPGQRVDLTGCNADLDGDGVANAHDRCPATPAGVSW